MRFKVQVYFPIKWCYHGQFIPFAHRHDHRRLQQMSEGNAISFGGLHPFKVWSTKPFTKSAGGKTPCIWGFSPRIWLQNSCCVYGGPFAVKILSPPCALRNSNRSVWPKTIVNKELTKISV